MLARIATFSRHLKETEHSRNHHWKRLCSDLLKNTDDTYRVEDSGEAERFSEGKPNGIPG